MAVVAQRSAHQGDRPTLVTCWLFPPPHCVLQLLTPCCLPRLFVGHTVVQKELHDAQGEREALQRKMNEMQGKVIVGGVNLVRRKARALQSHLLHLPAADLALPTWYPTCQLQKAEEQDRMLEEARRELERREAQHAELEVCLYVLVRKDGRGCVGLHATHIRQLEMCLSLLTPGPRPNAIQREIESKDAEVIDIEEKYKSLEVRKT